MKKLYSLVRYVLNISIYKIDVKKNLEDKRNIKEFIKEDINNEIDKLVNKFTSIKSSFAYRVNAEKIYKNLWYVEIRCKDGSVYEEKKETLKLIYKFTNTTSKAYLIK